MLWPVPGHRTVTSGFDDSRAYGPHAGFDIAAPAVPCVAVDYGTIVFTGWAGSAGRSVYVALDNGHRVHYCHLSDFRGVFVGKRVTPGSQIGYVGGSGYGVENYFGLHLHLNLFGPAVPADGPNYYIPWVGMWAVDPELYLTEEEDDMTLEEMKRILDHVSKATRTHAEGVKQHVALLLDQHQCTNADGSGVPIGFSDVDLQRIAKAVANEIARRMGE